jgi:GxxExxY protein
MLENDIATKIIGIAIELHKRLSPGLLESAYEHALQFDLIEAGFKVQR